MRMSTVLATIFITILGCKEYIDAPLSPSEQKRVDKALYNSNPSPQRVLNVDVEDQIRLWVLMSLQTTSRPALKSR